MILTSHDMNVVQDTCERVIIINEGRIVADDSIDHLLDLFQVKVCRIVIGESLTPPSSRPSRPYPRCSWKRKTTAKSHLLFPGGCPSAP